MANSIYQLMWLNVVFGTYVLSKQEYITIKQETFIRGRDRVRFSFNTCYGYLSTSSKNSYIEVQRKLSTTSVVHTFHKLKRAVKKEKLS